MNGYFLTEGSSSSGSGSGYPNRFQFLNDLFERHLGKFVGEGWGVRNWFGPCQDGDWGRVGGSLDYWHITLGAFLFLFVGYVLVSLWVDILRTSGTVTFTLENIVSLLLPSLSLIIYLLLVLLAIIAWIVQTFESKFGFKMPTEYMSAGDISEVPQFFRKVILSVSIWVVIYYAVGYLSSQSVLPISFQAITPISSNLLYVFVISVIFIPFAEAAFFVGLWLAITTRFLGIIPALILISLVTGGFHSFIFATNQLNLIMSILFGFMTYPIALKYKTKEPAVQGHWLANLIAFITTYVKI